MNETLKPFNKLERIREEGIEMSPLIKDRKH